MQSADPKREDRAAAAAAVTHLLNGAAAGDRAAADQLLPLVYDQLRALAGRRMRQERATGHTLEATALVHEAYLRLVDTTRIVNWDNRWHFFAAAAQAMRRILVDHARRRNRLKRGGDRTRVDLDTLDLAAEFPSDELLALDEALAQLAREQPEHAKLVDLRFFGGLSNEDAAAALGISTATADRRWAYAKAWLYRRMSQE